MTGTYPADVIRCPVHNMPDCSPLLNGCTIPARLAQAYDAGKIDWAAREPNLSDYAREELALIVADDTHIVNLTDPTAYGLRHGFPCRAQGLLGCPVDRALAALAAPPDVEPGYYFVMLDPDGGLRIGNPTTQAFDPIRGRIDALIERLTDG